MNEMFSLVGKKAIVTGGGKGIGKSVALSFLEFGAEVVITGSSDDIFVTEREFIAKGYGNIHAVKGDFLFKFDRDSIFEKCIERLDGTVDILVNNAGIQRRHPAEDFPIEDWNQVIEMNLTVVFELCQKAVKIMKDKGSGCIINIASMTSFRSSTKNVIAYQAAKSAVRQITKAMAHEWAEYGIRVNAIAPGWTKTNMTSAVSEDPVRYEAILEQIPMKRWGAPDDYKGAAILLASSAGQYINGITLAVDGGYLAR